MKTNFLLTLLTGLLVFTACSEKPAATYTINGTIPDNSLDGKMIYIYNRNNNNVYVDSTVVTGNTFTFTGKMDTAAYCRIDASREYYVNFILENGTINLDLSKPVTPSGSPLNNEIARFFAAQDSMSALIDAKRQEFIKQTEDKAERMELQKNFFQNEWKPAYLSMLDGFFNRNLDNPIGAIALNYMDGYLSPDEIKAKLPQLSEVVRNTPNMQETIQRFNALEQTAEGKPFVDFTIETKDGNKVSLSDYVGKGKYTLVDFWASWCGPCRWAIPKVEQLYKRYGDDRLAVVSVSLDKKREDWEKALKQENMPWTQLGVDGNDMLVTVSRAYHITRIPRLLLIAPDGRVVFSGHDVNALRLTVEKLL